MSDKAKSPKQKEAVKTWELLRYPLLLYSLVGIVYVYKLKGLDFFSWHPWAMFFSFVTLAGNATLLKKIGGLENTRMHGYLMCGATILAYAGYWVIHSIKDKYNKPHWQSLHAQCGVGALVGYTALAIFGGVALHPDWGVFKGNQLMRAAHKWAGRLVTALAWGTCVLGLRSGNMYNDVPEYVQGLFMLPLLLFGFYVLLD